MTSHRHRHRHQDEAGVGRRDSQHPLGVHRQVDHRAEHHHRDHEARDVGQREDRAPEQVQRQDGLHGAPLDGEERCERDEPSGIHDDDGQRVPGPGRAAQRRGNEQEDERQGQQRDARPVDDRPLPDVLEVEEPADPEVRRDADGQADEEEQAPAPVVGDEAADERPEDRGEAEHATHEALVLAPLPRRNDVADDRLRQGHEGPHPDALHCPGGDEPPEVLRQAGQDRADHEDDEPTEVEPASPVDVRELADDGHGDRAGEHGGSREPRVVLHPAQLRDDARHRRADDGLADRGHQHAEHEGREDLSRSGIQPGGRTGRVSGRGRR